MGHHRSGESGTEMHRQWGGEARSLWRKGSEDLQFRYAEATAPSEYKLGLGRESANVVAVQVCIMVQSSGNGVITAHKR